jgi:transposase-like protein
MNRRKPEQIVRLLHQVDETLGQGKKIEDILREQQISPATYYRWKQKYGGMNVQDAKKLKELEVENAKLKRLLAEAMLANDALKEFISKKV